MILKVQGTLVSNRQVQLTITISKQTSNKIFLIDFDSQTDKLHKTATKLDFQRDLNCAQAIKVVTPT